MLRDKMMQNKIQNTIIAALNMRGADLLGRFGPEKLSYNRSNLGAFGLAVKPSGDV